MPHRENSAGKRGLGAEVLRCQAGCQARVLHTNLDCGRASCTVIAARDTACEVSKEVAQQVVEDDHNEDDECGFHDLVGGLTNDCCQHVRDAKDGDPGKCREDLFNVAPSKHTDNDACDDRDQNDLDDRDCHALCINRHVLTGQPLGEKGGHEGCQKGGN